MTGIEIPCVGCYHTFWPYESLAQESDLVTGNVGYTSGHNTKLAVGSKVAIRFNLSGTATIFRGDHTANDVRIQDISHAACATLGEWFSYMTV